MLCIKPSLVNNSSSHFIISILVIDFIVIKLSINFFHQFHKNI